MSTTPEPPEKTAVRVIEAPEVIRLFVAVKLEMEGPGSVPETVTVIVAKLAPAVLVAVNV